jgi:hypothetical protein
MENPPKKLKKEDAMNDITPRDIPGPGGASSALLRPELDLFISPLTLCRYSCVINLL